MENSPCPAASVSKQRTSPPRSLLMAIRFAALFTYRLMRSIHRIAEGHRPGVVNVEEASPGHIAHKTADRSMRIVDLKKYILSDGL